MYTRRIITCLALGVLALCPLAVHAQHDPLFVAQINASVNVYRGPGTEHLMVGYLEPGMPVRVFGCNADCSWLDIGPNVWIQSGAITPPDGALPLGLSIPVTVATPIPTATISAPISAPAMPVAPTPTPQSNVPGAVPPTAVPTATMPPAQTQNCDPSYPDFCLAPGLPDLDCDDIPYDNFTVLPPDPHDFDRESDGIGCEN